MNPQLFFAFVPVAAALACTPGVDWAYSITRGAAAAQLCAGRSRTLRRLCPAHPADGGRAGGRSVGYARTARLAHRSRGRLPAVAGISTLRSWRGASFTAAAAVGKPAPTSSGPSSRAWAPAASTPKACCSMWRWCRSSSAPKRLFPLPVQSGLLGLTFVLLAGNRLHLRGAAGPQTPAVPARRRPHRDARQRHHHGAPGRACSWPSSCFPLRCRAHQQA